ncbi:PE-PGRS family protein PE_PGRS3-like [Penaeus vannamei]|uniref:PE-PGRS family protein PE_PGRS3-like n=1 Tax=Penaeus vannamei TaxID=6689 RepID=UPI00387F8B96
MLETATSSGKTPGRVGLACEASAGGGAKAGGRVYKEDRKSSGTQLSLTYTMKGLSVILCCVLALVSANGKGNQQGNKRFFQGGFPGGHGGFPGGVGGGFPGGVGGGFPGGVGGGFPGGVGGGFPGGIGGGFPGGIGGGFPGGFPSATAPPATCRRWCRTPEQQVYCCESAFEPEAPVGTKPLDCPQVRPTCPPTRFGGQPVTCSSDYKCGGLDKCCFDRCLAEHVCKPPSFYSQFG